MDTTTTKGWLVFDIFATLAGFERDLSYSACSGPRPWEGRGPATRFHLDNTDRAFVVSHRGDHNRLGVAVQLGFVRMLGMFPEKPENSPASAHQLFITEPEEIRSQNTLTAMGGGNMCCAYDSTTEGPDLSLECLEKIERPASLVALRAAIDARLPRLNLPELIM